MVPIPLFVFSLLIIIGTVYSVPLAAVVKLHASTIVSASPKPSEMMKGKPKRSSQQLHLSRPSVEQFKPSDRPINNAKPLSVTAGAKPVKKEYHSKLPNWVDAVPEDILQIKRAANGLAISYGLSEPKESNQDIMLMQKVDAGLYQVNFAINSTSKDFLISVHSNADMTSWIDNLQRDTIKWPFPTLSTKDTDSLHQSTLVEIMKLKLNEFLFKDPDATFQINRGFITIWNDLRPKVLSVMQNIVMQSCMNTFYPKAKIVITGSGLSGAVASIMAMDLVQCNIVKADRAQLTTFGSPQVGNGAFASTMDRMNFNSILRVIRVDDKIPYFPGPKLGYVHFQGARYIDKDGSVYVSGDDLQFLDDGDEPGLIPSIKAHAGMYEYMTGI